MRISYLLVLVMACGDGSVAPATPDADSCPGVFFFEGCVADGLADLPFDGSVTWLLVGTRTEARNGPPMTTAVNRSLALARTGTGCGGLDIDGRAVNVNSTHAWLAQPAETTRVPSINIDFCKRDDGKLAFRYKTSGFAMQVQYTIEETGEVTQSP